MKLCPALGDKIPAAAGVTGLSQRLGTVGLALFSFFAWLSTAAANLGLFMVLVAFLLDARNAWTRLKKEPLLFLAAILLFYLCVRTVFGIREFPDLASEQMANGAAFFLLWLFLIPVAWSIEGKIRKVFWVLGLATAGLVIEMLLHIRWNNIAETLFTYKPFELGVPSIGVGLYSGTMLLGLLLFASRICGQKVAGARFWLRAALWLVLFFILSESIIIDSSRGAWLSCALVFPVIIFLQLRAAYLRDKQFKRKAVLTGGVVAAAVLTPILWLNLPVIQERLSLEHGTIRAILAPHGAKVPFTSIGQRFYLNVYGFEKWAERPLLGWGAGLSRHLIEQHPLREVTRQEYPHVHNTYLDVTLELGLIGALLFLAGLVLILRALRRSHRRREIPYDIFLFLTGAWGMVLIWNLSNVRLDHVDGRFYLLIIGACAYTFQLFGNGGRDVAGAPFQRN